jgi:leucyl aminopeptidase
MEIRLKKTPASTFETAALITLEFEGQPHRPGLEELYESGEVSGKALEMTLVHKPAGYRASRLLLAGVGKPEKLTPADLIKVVGAAVRTLKSKSIKHCAIEIPAQLCTIGFVSHAVEGALLGDFENDQLKSDRSGTKFLESLTVLVDQDGMESAVEQGKILGEAQNLARSLANEPPNILTPTVLADRARVMASECGLAYEVLNQDQMRELGMGALLAVAMGSAEPPAMILLRYTPEKPAAGAAHLGLVGKGVTFDTGGISIKPAENMEKMKYDMAGAAAVIGAMQAIAKLKPSIPVTGVIPTVENMPGSRAQRPGDIVKTLSGKTVEVLNTDAEGRMILADAMTYATRIGCTHLVDAATLTGAIVVALGTINTGVFSNNDEFAARWMTAAAAEGEKMWRMPLDDEYKELLKSPVADLHNIGGRYGGAITAAVFLKEFADPTPWVHLDIAGTAWYDDAKPFLAKGPTGTPVRSFVRLALDWMDVK